MATALRSITAAISAPSKFGATACTRAATAATCGAAMDVPVSASRLFCGAVDQMVRPGAATATHDPKFENWVSWSLVFSVAATAMTAGYAAGKAPGRFGLEVLSLPAAAVPGMARWVGSAVVSSTATRTEERPAVTDHAADACMVRKSFWSTLTELVDTHPGEPE